MGRVLVQEEDVVDGLGLARSQTQVLVGNSSR
jgi:hypothetical protein